jgi:hypothetical protein
VPFRNIPGIHTVTSFQTFAQMPSLIHRAAKQHGYPSNTRYIQIAICEKLARDGIEPLPSLLAKLPTTRTSSDDLTLKQKAKVRRVYAGSKNIEEVK